MMYGDHQESVGVYKTRRVSVAAASVNISRREFMRSQLRWLVAGALALVTARLFLRRGGVRAECHAGCAACHRFSSCALPAAAQRKTELLRSRRS